jgi:hypothetical protein
MANGKPKFDIPESFLERLGEFSNGGFILTIINDDGNPVIYHAYDNAISQLGLQKFLSSWLEANEQINNDSTLQGIVESEGGFIDGDDEGFEEI